MIIIICFECYCRVGREFSNILFGRPMEGLEISQLLPQSYSMAIPMPPMLLMDLHKRKNSTNLLIEGKEIGAGNFGTVYRAKYNFLPCVVKVLHPNFQAGAMREAVYRECRRIVSSIRHPNIVQFLDVQDYSPPSPKPGSLPLVTLIMELMDENLTAFLTRHRRAGAISWHCTVDICHDVALALHYLHAKGIAYSILSSNNVLLLRGRAKISDLGVSKIQNLGSESSLYTAPEVRMNKVSLQSDVFSFGVLLIQIITLKPPDPKFMLTHDLSSGSLTMATESSRRKIDIAQIPKRHRLRSMALLCISDLESSRPTSTDLCNDFEGLKSKRDYKKSMKRLDHSMDHDVESSSSYSSSDTSGSEDGGTSDSEDSSTSSNEDSDTD